MRYLFRSASKNDAAETAESQKFYPLKVKISSNSKLVLYFKDELERRGCYRQILNEQGFLRPIDQYKMTEDFLGGPSSTVVAAIHKASRLKVAVKVIYKDVETNADDLDRIAFVDLNRRLPSAYAPKYVEHFEEGEYLYAVT